MIFFECVEWKETTHGQIGFVMVYDDIEERLKYYVGIGQGFNERIDINHIFGGGYELPAEAGVAIFFGSWE